MKFFVTGVGGQLGHDVMNELIKRGHEGVGSDIQEQYSGVEDGSEVTKAPYLSFRKFTVVLQMILRLRPHRMYSLTLLTKLRLTGLSQRLIRMQSFTVLRGQPWTWLRITIRLKR